MHKKKVEISFKKLLGNGRAWRTPVGFTSELLDVFISPLSELKDRFINLKYTHFPTFFQDKNNIVNDEELFGIKDNQNKSLYWLIRETKISYPLMVNLADNKTISAKFKNIENICKVLKCDLNTLFNTN